MENQSSRELLQAELTKRLREALVLKDWTRLEHWARQWIVLLPGTPAGFKWLARATLAQNKVSKAAYAYGRLLDVDPANEEAKRFFAEHPSSIPEAKSPKTEAAKGDTPNPGPILNPEQRARIATSELETAKIYEELALFGEAAARFQTSNHWAPSQAAILGTARCFHRAHRGLDAVRFLREQLYQYPDWADGRALLGRVLFELGHAADAQREWQLVLKVNPDHKEALGFLREMMLR